MEKKKLIRSMGLYGVMMFMGGHSIGAFFKEVEIDRVTKFIDFVSKPGLWMGIIFVGLAAVFGSKLSNYLKKLP